MRRALSLLAILTIGAVPTASAQTRPTLGVRLEGQPAGPPNLILRVSSLLDDPQWMGSLASAYSIRLHWRVQLWQSHALIDRPLAPVEWEDVIQQVPVIDVYTYTEPSRAGPITSRFRSLDSLKTWVGQELRLRTPTTLTPGRWYYTVDLSVSAQDETGDHGASNGDPGGLSGALRRIILGGGPSDNLSQAKTIPFTVPNR